MAPKAKAKGKARAKGAAKAKPVPKPKAKVRARVMRALVAGRRTAARGGGEAPLTVEERWRRGEEVDIEKVQLGWIGTGALVALPAASYYLQECKVAGTLQGIEMKDEEVHGQLHLLGTTSENLLKLHTANPDVVFRLHFCKSGCNQQEVADHLLHAKKWRQILDVEKEEGWVTNLEKVRPVEAVDEMNALRARGLALGEAGQEGEPDRDKEEKKERKKKKVKDTKKKKEKKKEKPDPSTVSSSESLDARLDGTMAKQACKKDPNALYKGTGLDSREKVRRRVARRARRAMRKKSKKGSSSEDSGSSGTSRRSVGLGEDETVFQQASKVKLVATGFPGTLACQALSQMRSVLLSEIGTEDRPGTLKACALAYFRQQLSRKASGPAQRELLSIATAVDMMLNGNAAGALDVLIQRFKSCETMLAGCHWTVAQRLELAPAEGILLTPNEEMVHARRDIYEESRLKWLSAQPDGRAGGSSGKGGGKTKGEGREGRQQRWQRSPMGQRGRPKRRPSKEEGGERWQVVAGDSSGKDESRAMALEGPMNEASNRTESGYEGGMALAPRWCCDAEDLGPVSQTGGGTPDHWGQSVHAAAPKWAGENSFVTVEGAKIGTLGDAVAAFETTAETFERGPQKVEARATLSGKSLADCGSFLANRLLEVLPLRSQSTGRGSPASVFRLPTSRSTFLSIDEKMDEGEVAWAQCVTLSLNSLWGGSMCHEGEPNVPQQRCLAGIVSEVKRFCGIQDRLEDCDWKAFFSIRSIDYKGDEVRVARTFTWSNIAPALPKEIGKVPLAEVCDHGSRHYVLNFDHYLKPRSEWQLRKPPRVMVDDAHWAEVCRGLVSAGVCTYIEESEVFCTDQGPLLNGLFGVTKEETTSEGVEIFRLIMNLIPLNSLCRPMSGDVDTLPAWSGMSPFFIQPSQCLLVSSEDVKCFFYTLSLPPCWVKFLAFNKKVPNHALPLHLQGRTVYLASLVLPMGFLNSVTLAQHVHRNLALAAQGNGAGEPCNAPERELRKDRPFASGSSVWRIYLDNYDLLEKVEATEMVDMQGTCAPGVLALRQEYQRWEVPRNLKKSVERSSKCEVQGATVDGVAGVAYPREAKLAKYFSMALALCEQKRGTQKQWQVICRGLVYFSMFRRPLLGGLNRVWQHIESFESGGSHLRLTPADCRLEVLRFLGCLPLARLDFRLDMDPIVTCSDASMEGGGICASSGLTPYGTLVSEGGLRGEQPGNHTDNMVLSVGLFDGIGALRVALDVLGVPVIGHVSVEKEAVSNRVVESHYPGCAVVTCMEDIDEQMVIQWSTRFSQCTIVVLGAGPPCQGVSGLNSDRLGALKDARSSLFAHVPRVRGLLKKHFPWCPVYTLMESVASMDNKDRDTMSEAIGCRPLSCNAGTFTWCNRPRLYWIDWEVDEQYVLRPEPSGDWSPAHIVLHAEQDISQVIRRGWLKVDPDSPFPTFTTSRPQVRPGRKPAGIQQCSSSELERWAKDLHRFPPYQYREQHCLVNRENVLRIPDVNEREVMLGFPLNYTLPCLPKNERKGAAYNDQRLTLLGNTWSVPVVAWLLGQLLGAQGLLPTPSPQQVLDSLQPEGGQLTQGRLVRAPLNAAKGVSQERKLDLNQG